MFQRNKGRDFGVPGYSWESSLLFPTAVHLKLFLSFLVQSSLARSLLLSFTRTMSILSNYNFLVTIVTPTSAQSSPEGWARRSEASFEWRTPPAWKPNAETIHLRATPSSMQGSNATLHTIQVIRPIPPALLGKGGYSKLLTHSLCKLTHGMMDPGGSCLRFSLKWLQTQDLAPDGKPVDARRMNPGLHLAKEAGLHEQVLQRDASLAVPLVASAPITLVDRHPTELHGWLYLQGEAPKVNVTGRTQLLLRSRG